MTDAEQGKSPDNPWPVRAVATRVAKYIDRLGTVWIEGQLTELKVRQSTAWMVLRDPAADMSLTVSCPRDLVTNAPVPLSEGTQVIMHGKPQFYTRNGSFSLRISEIRAVGLGELLARIERLRRLLDAEGLFDPRLKRPIPFLPRTIGLITGRASHAERDVISVATDRWPAVHFAVRNTAVQGTSTVPQVVEALRELDADPNVDVIVIARGGGALEDLLPFSSEELIRAVADASTPVVSAIGHEADRPILDDVADLRASTPTDAAKRIVPDVAEELVRVRQARDQLRRGVTRLVEREGDRLASLRSRPVLLSPDVMISQRHEDVERLKIRSHSAISAAVVRAADQLVHLKAQVRALSPQKTLDRGYAVVQLAGAGNAPAAHRDVVRHPSQAPAGTDLTVRVAGGRFTAQSTGGQEPAEE